MATTSVSGSLFPFPLKGERTPKQDAELIRVAASGDTAAVTQWDYENAGVPDE